MWSIAREPESLQKKNQENMWNIDSASMYSIKRHFWPCSHTVKIACNFLDIQVMSRLPHNGNHNFPSAKLKFKINLQWTKGPVHASTITRWLFHVTIVSFVCKHIQYRQQSQCPWWIQDCWGVADLVWDDVLSLAPEAAPLPVYLGVLWGEVELKSPVGASQRERGAVLTLALHSLCSAAV